MGAERLIFGMYSGALWLTTPLLRMYLNKRRKQGKEDPRRTHERRGAPTLPRPEGPLVWCHAASVGESLSLLDLIKRLRDSRPGLHVMVTTGTVTSAKLMADRLPEGAFHQFIPVDHPSWVRGFLDHWRPDCVLWAESELWPNLLGEIARRKIPAALINARISDRSFKRWQRLRHLSRALLGSFSVCLAQSALDAERLGRLGAPSCTAAGNLKYGSAPLPCDDKASKAFKKALKGRPVWLYSSSHPGEEEAALGVHKALQGSFKNPLTVIVPRHPHRGGEIAELCKTQGLTAQLRSHAPLPGKDTQVFIADTMGELGLFYRLCPVCVIGGSFVPHGGHNPIEPAQLGAAIVYGPHMFNFRAICADFAAANAALSLDRVADLAPTVAALLGDEEQRNVLAHAARELTMRKSAIADDYLARLEAILPAAPAQAPKEEPVMEAVG